MISSITSLPSVQPSPQAATAQPAPSTATPQASSTDTVQISNIAKALLQETMETSVQTAQEARGGDPQAIRLLAKEAAEKASAK
jgi:hypothetical protein